MKPYKIYSTQENIASWDTIIFLTQVLVQLSRHNIDSPYAKITIWYKPFKYFLIHQKS